MKLFPLSAKAESLVQTVPGTVPYNSILLVTANTLDEASINSLIVNDGSD